MSRTLTIDPLTRVEGHGKVHLELGDDGKVSAAFMSVLEFRGFERFVQGMQVELMPTITSRICGTCPHAHHLVSAKCLDRVFSAAPPRPAILLRQLLNCGSFIHSHAIHFFALAGPDLLLPADTPRKRRNMMTLLETAPDLTKKALRLRSIGQRIAEVVGGRGTHPVAAVAGGMAVGVSQEARAQLKTLAAEALGLARLAVEEGKRALWQHEAILTSLPLPAYDMGTLQGDRLDLYDGALRVQKPDGATQCDFQAADYAEHLTEEALPFSYGKQVVLKAVPSDQGQLRVGPLARVNCAKTIETPSANDELADFKRKWGSPCHEIVLGHHARLIELLYCAEKAVQLLEDDEIGSDQVRTQASAAPRSAVAHIEAPRGVLVHDYRVSSNGIIEAANFVVATQHNIAAINRTIKTAADGCVDMPDEQLLDRVEFAIRCYDPCLSCSTHQLGQMPLVVTMAHDGQVLRTLRR